MGANLTGIAYQKWKARILYLPFSPAALPPASIDANTGFVLFLKSPTLKEAFRPELEANDRFESRAAFEKGVDEFRRAVADLELDEVTPTDSFYALFQEA